MLLIYWFVPLHSMQLPLKTPFVPSVHLQKAPLASGVMSVVFGQSRHYVPTPISGLYLSVAHFVHVVASLPVPWSYPALQVQLRLFMSHLHAASLLQLV